MLLTQVGLDLEEVLRAIQMLKGLADLKVEGVHLLRAAPLQVLGPDFPGETEG